MKIIKRDGREVEFDEQKIVNAIQKAFLDTDGLLDENSIKISYAIADSIAKTDKKTLTVEEVQDLVEKKLMSTNRKDVSKSYILYRDKRARVRENESKYKNLIRRRINVTINENSNANVDESSFSGRQKEASADIFKALNQEDLPEFLTKAHTEMLVYQHDYEKAQFGESNCLNINFPRLLSKGFVTRNGDVRPANSFKTACQLIAVIFQCQSQVC